MLLDVKTACSKGPLEETVFVKQNPGFEDGSGRVGRLHRALYGLEQTAHAWHVELLKALKDIDYTPSVVDPVIFVTCGFWYLYLHYACR
jgi:hypothetical protein